MAEKKVCCVYRIQSILFKDRIYIGSTVDWIKRRSGHKRALEQGKHHSPMLQRHFDKYGKEDLAFIIEELIVFVSKERILEREQYYLDTLNPYFNTSKTAGSNLGLKTGPPSQEKRDKISESLMGHESWAVPHTEEAKRKIRESKVGKPLSKEHKAALKKAWEKRRLIPESEETKMRRSKSHKGKIPWSKGLTKETSPSVASAAEKNKGRVPTQETRDKISKKLKGVPHSDEHNKKVSLALKGKRKKKKEPPKDDEK